MHDTLHNLATRAKEAEKVTKYESVNLHDIRIADVDKLKIGKNEVELGRLGMNSLQQLLGIPNVFANRLESAGKAYKELLLDVSQRLAKLNDRMVTVKIYDDEMVSIFESDKNVLTDLEFLKVVSKLLDNKKVASKFKLLGETYDEKKGLISLRFANKNETMVVPNSPDELFRESIMMNNSSNLYFSSNIHELLERVVCTNLSTATDQAYRRKNFQHSNDNLQRRVFEAATGFFADTKGHAMEWMGEKVKAAQAVSLSLNEWFHMHRMIQDVLTPYTNGVGQTAMNAKQKLEEASDFLDEDRIISRYNRTLSELRGQSRKYLSHATTPVNYYDSFNYFTDLVSNTPFLRPETKLQGIVNSGNIIGAKQFDLMEKMPPQIKWN